VKFGTLGGIQKIRALDQSFDLASITSADCAQYQKLLTEDEWVLLQSNISDRDILLEAKKMFEGEEVWDDIRLGSLLNEHQVNLREHKRISTPKIDRMIESALQAGALGAKINGSGGGGCMFAYAPKNPEAVVEAIEKVGGKAYIIRVDTGTQVETESLFY
jgi:galactokinase